MTSLPGPAARSRLRGLRNVFADRKTGTKILMGFALMLVMIATNGIMALRSTSTLSESTIELYEHPFRVTRALLQVQVGLRTIQRDLADAVLTSDTATVDRIAAEIDKVDKGIDERFAVARQQFLGDKSKIDTIAKTFKDFAPTYREILNAARLGDVDAGMTLMKTKGAPQIAAMERGLADLQQFVRGTAERFMETARSTDQQIRMTTIAILAVAIALGLAVAVAISRSITVPLRGLNAGMAKLASGEFDVVLTGLGRRDEVGAIAGAVEEFKVKAAEKARLEAEERAEADRREAEANRTRVEREAAQQRAAEEKAAADRKAAMHRLADDFEKAVGNIIDTVSTASTELEAAANTLTKTAEATQQMSTVVASASEEASSNVQSVASATEEMTGSVGEISRQVQESSSIADQAVQQAQKTDSRINELSQAASRIGDVVKLITAIAEQTNLLALNATIEAARAGEAGKGFAVVAQEVKALAAQTAKATGEIGTQIAGMQTATVDSVNAIKEIGGTIDRISHIASTIAAAVEEQGAATQEIARNVQEAARGTAQVASNIVSVNRGAGETGSASAQVLASAQSLATESNHLKLEVRKFLETVRAA